MWALEMEGLARTLRVWCEKAVAWWRQGVRVVVSDQAMPGAEGRTAEADTTQVTKSSGMVGTR